MSEITILEVDSELGAGTRGASLGIGALKVVAHNRGATVFADYPSRCANTMNEKLWDPVTTPHAKYVSSIVEVYGEVAGCTASILKEGHTPFVLAGDHSTAGGTIAGIKMAFPDKRLGVVWIDAHADLHTPFTTPSGNVHGMPLATALAEDNLACQRNTPNAEALEAWEKLKSMGGAKLSVEDLVFVAVRDTEEQEDALMARQNMTNHTVEAVRNTGADAIVVKILDQLSDCDMIYVSFDVDSMDCDLVSHGTGTPVKNGLTPEEASLLMIGLLRDPRVCCAEIVEINPCLDEKTNTMAETAFEIFEQSLEALKNR